MRHIAATLCCFLSMVLTARAQTPQPPPPQSPRQALLDMFFGAAPDHLEKHLPEVTRKALKQLDTGTGPGFLAEFSMIAAQARAGGSNFQTFETGPVLLVSEEPQIRQKFEVIVDQDNLVGDENEIDLSFHMYRNGVLQTLPVIPRLTFLMKSEKDVWKLNEIALSVRMPLADPEFLKGFVRDLKKKQQDSNEMMASYSIRNIVAAEDTYRAEHSERGYTCSLAALTNPTPQAAAGENPRAFIDRELAAGKKNGYIFVVTGCDALHYKVAAEPAIAGAGQRAFCSDESGEIRFSTDGKATTCVSRGQLLNDAGFTAQPVD